MRNPRIHTSTAVFMLCFLFVLGFLLLFFFLLVSAPVSPLITHELLPSACLARRSVRTRTGLAPAFWMRVRGITSSASATALYGHCCTPSMFLAGWLSRSEAAISVAPPPGDNLGWNMTLRA